MKGYRTYVTLLVLIINKVLASLGFVQYGSEQVATAIDVLLAVVAFFFKYLSDKDAAPK